jgi:hypothetical protein
MCLIISMSFNINTQELEVTKEILHEINTFKLKKTNFQNKIRIKIIS